MKAWFKQKNYEVNEKMQKTTEKMQKITEIECSCFEAAIVKGLYENNDIGQNFGSTLGIKDHAADASKHGLIQLDTDTKLTKYNLTELGKKAYDEWGLKQYTGRSYLWPITTFSLESEANHG